MENEKVYLNNPLVKKFKEYESNGYEGNYFLYAGGGYGKTTAMLCLFKYLLDRASNSEKIAPIYIDVKKLNFNETNPIISYIHSKYSGCNTQESDVKNLFTNQAPEFSKKYAYYILIDGLNETNDVNKGNLIDIISDMANISNVRFVVSSRIKETFDKAPFCVFELQKLQEGQIKEYLDKNFGKKYNEQTNVKEINKSLIEILQIPMFMKVFSKTYDKRSPYPDIYDGKTVRKADILDSYIQKILKELKERTNSYDNNILEFVINFYLPALAFQMAEKNALDIASEIVDKKLNWKYFITFFRGRRQKKIKALIKSDDFMPECICIENFAMINDNEGNYSFVHQIWRDFFAAMHIINCMNAKLLDELEISVDENARQFVGELVREYDDNYKYSKKPGFRVVYKDGERIIEVDEDTRRCECDFEEKDNIEKPYSPIEHFMQKNHSALNDKKQMVIRNLIEIMKTTRNNHITARYDDLDLTQVEFYGDDYDLSGSTFYSSKIIKNVFASKFNGSVIAMCFSADSKKIAHLYCDREHLRVTGRVCFNLYVEDCKNGELKTILSNEMTDVKVIGMGFFDANTVVVNFKSGYLLYDLKKARSVFNTYEESGELSIESDEEQKILDYNLKNLETDSDSRENFDNKITNFAKKLDKSVIRFEYENFPQVIEISSANELLLNGKLLVKEAGDEFKCISLSKDNKTLFAGTTNGKIYIYSIDILQKSISLEKMFSNADEILCIAVSEDKSKLAYADFRMVQIHNLTKQSIISEYKTCVYNVEWSTCVQKNSSLYITNIWDNEICVDLIDLKSKCTVQTMFFMHEGFSVSESGDCLAVIVDNDIELWTVNLKQKLKKEKSIDVSEFLDDESLSDKLKLSFAFNDSFLLLNKDDGSDNKEILHGWYIGDRKRYFLNNDYLNAHIDLNKHKPIYSNIVGCDFSHADFCDEEKANEEIAVLLYQNGATKIPKKYLNKINNLFDKNYDSDIKIPIRLIVDTVERRYDCVYGFNDKLLLRKFMIACLNLGFCKPDDLLNVVVKFGSRINYISHEYNDINRADNYSIEDSVLYINGKLMRGDSKKYEINFFKAIAEVVFGCSDKHIAISNVLTEITAEKILNMDVNKSRIIMPETVHETICGETIDIRSGYDNYNLLISLAKQLFIAKGINENRVIANMFIYGYDHVCGKLNSDNDLEGFLDILDKEYSIYINRLVNSIEDETEIQIINDYQMLVNGLFSKMDDNYFAFCALITQDELRQKAMSKFDNENKEFDKSVFKQDTEGLSKNGEKIMKNEKENTFIVVNDQGEEVVCEILFTYEDEKTGTNYMVYTDNKLDDEGNTMVYASIFDPKEENPILKPIETDEEWALIEKILETLASGE